MALVRAAEKSVAEEILDILKDKGDISDQKYDELMKKAEAEKEAVEKAGDWDFYWKNGFNLNSKEKKFKLQFGGRIQADGAYIGADQEIDDAFQAAGLPNETGWGTEFRRARLFFNGTVYEDLFFRLQYDFASNAPAKVNDAYIRVQNIPYIGSAWIGHYKEPWGLEELTSSKYLTFMERSPAHDAFTPSRNMGIEFFNNAFNQRLYWGIGGFQESDDFGISFNDYSDWNLTTRVAGRPWLQGKDKFLHLALSYSHQFRNEDETTRRYRARPSAHLSPNFLVDTGDIAVDDVDLFTPEIALVYGPFSFQGEYYWNQVRSTTASDPAYTGWYAHVSYFVTKGDHRHYKGWAFARVSPKRNFSIKGGGIGAVELALRYSYLNLNHEALQGGIENDWSFGVNWYLTPNTRFQFNYVRANVEDRTNVVIIPDNDVNILQSRFQIDF
jgi:phosphate-selective porin OprO/OprP